jgi:hypothetical protein
MEKFAAGNTGAEAFSLPREASEELRGFVSEILGIRYLVPSWVPDGRSSVFLSDKLESARGAAAEVSLMNKDSVDVVHQVWYATYEAAEKAGLGPELNRVRTYVRDVVNGAVASAAESLEAGKEQASFIASDIARIAEAKASLIVAKGLKMENIADYWATVEAAWKDVERGYGVAGIADGSPCLYGVARPTEAEISLEAKVRNEVEGHLSPEALVASKGCIDRVCELVSFIPKLNYFGAVPIPGDGIVVFTGNSLMEAREAAGRDSFGIIADDAEWSSAASAAFDAIRDANRAAAMSWARDAVWKVAFDSAMGAAAGCEEAARDIAAYMSLKTMSIFAEGLDFDGKGIFEGRINAISDAVAKGWPVMGIKSGTLIAYAVGPEFRKELRA